MDYIVVAFRDGFVESTVCVFKFGIVNYFSIDFRSIERIRRDTSVAS
jgi:hypothetical protein